MTPNRLAAELGISPKSLRAWLRRTYPRPESQKHSEWYLTPDVVAAVRAHFGAGTSYRAEAVSRGSAPPAKADVPTTGARAASDEAYVIDICDEILGERGSRQHCFPWLLGDPGQRGSRRQLPVDAYYPRHEIVVEYRERQHDEPTPFFDRRQTVSGVGRGEQRRLYDERRETEIPAHGLRLVIIRPRQLDSDSRGRLRRTKGLDAPAIRHILQEEASDDPASP